MYLFSSLCHLILMSSIISCLHQVSSTTTWWQRRDRKMANPIPVATLRQFDFKRPDQWLRWKHRFKQFLSASGLEKESDKSKVSTLLYCLSADTDNVLTSTNIGDNRKKYSKVIEKFDAHFRVQCNVIFEYA